MSRVKQQSCEKFAFWCLLGFGVFVHHMCNTRAMLLLTTVNILFIRTCFASTCLMFERVRLSIFIDIRPKYFDNIEDVTKLLTNSHL